MPPLVVSVLFTLASVLVSCSHSDSADSQWPTEVLTPVDCTNLCPAPDRLADEATQSDSVRLAADRPDGTGQVLLGWDDGSGAQRWLLPAPTTDASIGSGQGVDGLLVWKIRIAIPCLPESAVNVQLTREGETAALTPGTYPMVSVAFDVPARQQSVDLDSMEVSGDVVITSATDDLVSGYMQGRGGGRIQSIAHEDLGLRYDVAAMRFDQIAGEQVAGP